MAEEKLQDLLTRLVGGKEEQDARMEALLQAIKNPPAPAAAVLRAEKVQKITFNIRVYEVEALQSYSRYQAISEDI